jgi:hypothetical protein
VQSGAGRENVLYLDKPNPRGLPSAESDGVAFVASLGSEAKTAADLRALPASAILDAGDPSTFSGGGPIIDGKIITTTVMRLSREQAPYLIARSIKPEDVARSRARCAQRRTCQLVAATTSFNMAAKVILLAIQRAGFPHLSLDVLYICRMLGAAVILRCTSPWPTDANDQIRRTLPSHAGSISRKRATRTERACPRGRAKRLRATSCSSSPMRGLSRKLHRTTRDTDRAGLAIGRQHRR